MMKSEPKPFASLSSGLLARKGAARPAMRPQGFGQMGSGLEDLGWNDMGFEPPRPTLAPVTVAEEPHSAIRSNPALGLTPASPVHAVQDEIVHRLATDPVEDLDETAEPLPDDIQPLEELLAEPIAEVVPMAPTAPVAEILQVPSERVVTIAAAPARAPRSRAAAGKAKAAFTLRLDQDRHLKLRLACAVTGTSAQQLVTRALDELLATMPELEAMASRAPERQSVKG
jgi:hypothetical protein